MNTFEIIIIIEVGIIALSHLAPFIGGRRLP